MKSEFSERNYEFYLNCELKKNDIFIPTQNLEGKLGIDSIIFTRDIEIFDYFHEYELFLPFGIFLEPDLWEDAPKYLDKRLPKIRANLFIQYKVPEYVKNKKTGGYQNWRKPYFTYSINKDQQEILAGLESNLSKNALVIYSCPAFYRLNKLLEFGKNQTIKENSNFVKPSSLTGHESYTFIDKGSDGLALSEPRKIPKLNIDEAIQKLKKLELPSSNINLITEISDIMDNTIRNLNDNKISSFWNQIMKYLDRWLKRNIPGIKPSNLDPLKKLIKIIIFLHLTNTAWLIVY